MDSNGNLFTDQKNSSQVFINYYFDLWKETTNLNFQEILSALPDDPPEVSASDGEMLVREVAKKEVHEGL